MSFLNQVKIPPPGLSIGADIYGQYRRGEISEKDYHIFNASMAASLAHEEQPRIYPPMIPPIRNYVESRIMGRSQYDPQQCAKLGQWRLDVFRAYDHNTYIIEHFQWAKAKCDSVKLEKESERLEAALRRFSGLKVPYEDYDCALRVLVMDSEAKQRKVRES